MATFYLIRHGTNDWLGRGLAGRLPEVHLNEQGRAEAEALARALERKGIQRILSSPLERARETAEPLARLLGLPTEISEALLEVDFGDWNGAFLADLQTSRDWGFFNTFRSGAQIPNVETMVRIQARMVGAIAQWRRDQPDGCFALFSHGDPIRSVLSYYLGMPLDFLTRIEVSPGSISELRLEEWGAEILRVNTLPAFAGIDRR
jgi:probable phosphoglycerate mutase